MYLHLKLLYLVNWKNSRGCRNVENNKPQQQAAAGNYDRQTFEGYEQTAKVVGTGGPDIKDLSMFHHERTRYPNVGGAQADC